MSMLASARMRKGVVTALATSVVVAGCTTQTERLGASSPTSDVCHAYVKALDATGDYFAEDMIKGAAAGALAGGLLGALAGGDAQSALIGAAAGAAVGAAGGYMYHLQQQSQDKQVLYNTVLTDVERENAKIDEAQFALNKVVDCRENAFTQIRNDYKAGRLNRVEADRRWNEQIALQRNDANVARQLGKNMEGRSQEYLNANNTINDPSQLSAADRTRIEQQRASIDRRHQAELAEMQRKLDAQEAQIRKQKLAAAEADRRRKEAQKQAALLKQRQNAEKASASANPKVAQAVFTNQSKMQTYNSTVAALDNPPQPGGFESTSSLTGPLRSAALGGVWQRIV